ncbi:MAG: helix-hairpin-helix domain-containing protein, partial [Actinomycetota bacterium]|nr:helix-hairpin-helix domain-containing protein [Actinomycetota bacterium]
SIESSKTRPLANVLVGLGIPHVGGTTARDLAAEVGSLKRLAEMTADELAQLEGIGPIVAGSIEAFFDQERNVAVLQKLRAGGVKPPEVAKKKAGPLTGKSFVLTGTLDGYTRDQAAAAIEERGGK